MPNNLTIRLTIPFVQPVEPGLRTMWFHRWLPQSDTESIVVSEGGFAIKLSFDRSCVLPLGEASERTDFSGVVTVIAQRVFTDVEATALPEPLVQHILECSRQNSRDDTHPLANDVRNLACQVVGSAIKQFNRFVSFVHSVKGQYWLEEYQFDPDNVVSTCNLFRAMVNVGGEWLRFYVPGILCVFKTPLPNTDRFISEADWPRIRDLMTSSRKPPLVWQLLARAEWLLESGHRRGALTEAVSALEMAIHNFSRYPNAEKAFGPVLASRLRVSTLNKQIEHVGLSGTVKYLLPIIFTEDKIPTNILQDCQEAVEERQNVIHNGKRDVLPERTACYLRSIRNLCQTLERYSEPATDE
jgi:hypothetical protein